MVAGGQAIDARLVKIIANLRRDAEAMGRVLDIHDHGVELVFLAERLHLRGDGVARIAADDVA